MIKMSSQRLKILVTGTTSENIEECIKLVDRLAGIDHRSQRTFSPLRILEISLKNGYEVEIWNLLKPLIPVPEICLHEAHGLVLLSYDLPRNLVDRNKPNLLKADFPILWMVTERTSRYNPTLSGFNVHQLLYSVSDEESLQNELINWISKEVYPFSTV